MIHSVLRGRRGVRVGVAAILLMLLAGCGQPVERPSQSEIQMPPVVDESPGLNATVNETLPSEPPAPVAPLLFSPTWFDCDALQGAFPVPGDIVRGWLPEGYEPAAAPGDISIVTTLLASCAGLLVDNQTYEQQSGFGLVFVNVQVPQEFRHEGGADGYILSFLPENSRVTDESRALGVTVEQAEISIDALPNLHVRATAKTPTAEAEVWAAAGPDYSDSRAESFYLHWVTPEGSHEMRSVDAAFSSGLQQPSSSVAPLDGNPLLVTGPGLGWFRQGSWSFGVVE